MNPKVNILLATYNGARFLCDQLRSIQLQTVPVARLTVRDDGSTDETTAVLEQWASGNPTVTLLRGQRLGVTGNFLTLLGSRDEDSDFFAFCDQDDVWLPDKLESALLALREYPVRVPVLYCSRVEYVDEGLRHQGYSKIPKRIGFANALVENIATGCTVVMNRCSRSLICERPPTNALLHDWWCYLVVSALGKVIYDERPSIKYRQHAGNQVGATASPAELFKRRLKRFYRRKARLLSDQAVEFRRCFGDLLTPQDKKTLDNFLSVREGIMKRVCYSGRMDVFRQSPMDTMILRALVLMGRV